MVLGIGLAAAIFTTHLAQGGTESFYTGIGQAFLVAAGIALLGVFVSAVPKTINTGRQRESDTLLKYGRE